jgi:hypothetical protein
MLVATLCYVAESRWHQTLEKVRASGPCLLITAKLTLLYFQMGNLGELFHRPFGDHSGPTVSRLPVSVLKNRNRQPNYRQDFEPGPQLQQNGYNRSHSPGQYGYVCMFDIMIIKVLSYVSSLYSLRRYDPSPRRRVPGGGGGGDDFALGDAVSGVVDFVRHESARFGLAQSKLTKVLHFPFPSLHSRILRADHRTRG